MGRPRPLQTRKLECYRREVTKSVLRRLRAGDIRAAGPRGGGRRARERLEPRREAAVGQRVAQAITPWPTPASASGLGRTARG